MDERSVDVAVIGAGTAGLNAVHTAAKAGASWVLIESGPYGSTCARVGCMPSKLLIAAADAAHHIQSADVFGISVNGMTVDGPAVMQRLRAERDRFVGFVVADTQKLPIEQRLSGIARFVGPNTLEVGDHTRVIARAVVIATGSSPTIPPPFDAVRSHIMTSDDIFELQQLPRSMAVIGTGIIGLELGQAMRRLGVEVTFFARSDILGPLTDPEVKKVVSDRLGKELDCRLNVTVTGATPSEHGLRLSWCDADQTEHAEVFEQVLVATGRRPNVAELDLATTGLELDERGQPPWDPRTGQCGDQPIFMSGDADNYLPFLPAAATEGSIAGQNAALFPDVEAHARPTPLAITFVDPQMAMTGLRYDQLDLDQIGIGEVSFADQGRARVMDVNHGLLRVYGRRQCGTLVGAEMFGPRMEHIAHLLALAIQQKLTVEQALTMPFYHPVFEEGVRTALRNLAKQIDFSERCRDEDMALQPGD